MSRQDYIARVRYQNTLPPPPCGPKLLRGDPDFENLLSAGSLSALLYSKPLDPVVDEKLGMPIDLVRAPHAFEGSMYDLPGGVELDPEDAVLLEDASAGVPAATAVAFLRRTEYSTNAMLRGNAGRKAATLEVESPSQQAHNTEESFLAAATPLGELRHPQKQLKATKAWKILPDTKQIDLEAKSVRMIGSAAISQNKHISLNAAQLDSALFSSRKLENQDSAAFFVPREEEAEAYLQDKRHEGRDDERFELVKLQDYEMVSVSSKNKFDEVVLSLDSQNAYYLPVQSRINLKRRRVGAFEQEEVERGDLDLLDLTCTDISAEGNILRDQKRSSYDPVSYA